MRNLLRNKKRLERELQTSDIFHFVLHKCPLEDFEKPKATHPKKSKGDPQRISLHKFLLMKENSERLVTGQVAQDKSGHTFDSVWDHNPNLSHSEIGYDHVADVAHQKTSTEVNDEDASLISLELEEMIRETEESKPLSVPSEESRVSFDLPDPQQSRSLQLSPFRNIPVGRSGRFSINSIRHVSSFKVVDPAGRKGLYTGPIAKSSGMPYGYGRLEYTEEDEIFEGEFSHGFWMGQGRCIYKKTGEDYSGFFLNTIRHGHGVTKYKDGRVYDGTYSHGDIVEGKMMYVDGASYLGQFSQGLRHGRGIYSTSNRDVDKVVFHGEFRNDQIHGSGVLTLPDGSRFIGHWKNGVREGFGQEVHPNGSIIRQGMWRNGDLM